MIGTGTGTGMGTGNTGKDSGAILWLALFVLVVLFIGLILAGAAMFSLLPMPPIGAGVVHGQEPPQNVQILQPAPGGVAQGAAAANPPVPGGTPTYYWVVAQVPAGLTAPSPAIEAQNTAGVSNLPAWAANPVTVSWTGAQAASGYYVLRSGTPVFPAQTGCADCLVGSGSALVLVDTGIAGSAYPPAGVPGVSATPARWYLNNRDQNYPASYTQIGSTAYRTGLLDPAYTPGDFAVVNSQGVFETEPLPVDNITGGVRRVAFANVPPCISDNRNVLYLFTDAVGSYQCDGANYQYYLNWRPLNPPTLTGFVWTNQGGASVYTAGPLQGITAPALAGQNLRVLTVPAPGADYRITAVIQPNNPQVNFTRAGVIIRSSVSGRLMSCSVGGSGAQWAVDRWTSPTVLNGTPITQTFGPWQASSQALWLRVTWVGINDYTCEYSFDGLRFVTLFLSTNESLFFTLGNVPDEVGYFVDPNNATFPAALTVYHQVLEAL